MWDSQYRLEPSCLVHHRLTSLQEHVDCCVNRIHSICCEFGIESGSNLACQASMKLRLDLRRECSPLLRAHARLLDSIPLQTLLSFDVRTVGCQPGTNLLKVVSVEGEGLTCSIGTRSERDAFRGLSGPDVFYALQSVGVEVEAEATQIDRLRRAPASAIRACLSNVLMRCECHRSPARWGA